MAAGSRGNVIYVNEDTGQDTPPFDYGDAAPYDYSRNALSTNLQKAPLRIKSVTLMNVSGDATLKIQDGGNGEVGIDPLMVLDLSANDNLNSSHHFQFETPIFCPNGIIITEITNCSAQLIVEETKR